MDYAEDDSLVLGVQRTGFRHLFNTSGYSTKELRFDSGPCTTA